MIKEIATQSMTLPCHDCIKADIGPDGRAVLCRRVTNVVLEVAQREYGVDITIDTRPESQIAAAQLGKYVAVDTAVVRACIQVPLPPQADMLSMLDRIQC